MNNQKIIAISILSALALFGIGIYIGGVIKKKKLIGDRDEDTLLFRKELTGVPNEVGGGDGFRQVSPDGEDFYVCKCNRKKE